MATADHKEETYRLAEEKALLAEIGRIISSSLDIGEVYDRFVEKVRRLVPADRIAVSVADPEKGIVTNAYVAGGEVEDRRTGEAHDLSGSATGYVLETGKGLLVHPSDEALLMEQFPGLLPAFRAGYRSIIVAPLISNGRAFGALHLRSRLVNAYTESDLQLAEDVAMHISGAVANAQLYARQKQVEEELRRSEESERLLAKENAALAEIGRIMGSSLDIQQVYQRFSELVRGLISCDRISITIPDADDYCFTSYFSGVSPRTRQIGQKLPLAGSITEEVIQSKRLLVLSGREETWRQRFPANTDMAGAGLRSVIAAPLTSKDSVVGVLHIWSARMDAFSQRDVEVTERIAVQIAGVIANYQLHAALEREARERAILAEIGRVISSSLNIDEVYEPFTRLVQQMIPFDRITIGSMDLPSGQMSVLYVAGIDVPSRRRGSTVPLQGTISAAVAECRAGMIVHADSEDELAEKFPGLLASFRAGLRSVLAAPLISNDGVIGALQLRSRQPNAYTRRHLALAESVATQIAGAIAISQLHTERLKAQAALAESERRYRHMIEGATDVVYTTDAQGCFTYVNPPALRFTGYSAEELLGRRFITLIAPRWRRRVEKFYDRQYLRRLPQTVMTVPVMVKSGEVRWLEQAVALQIADDEVTGFQAIGRDVTQRKKAEAERERLIVELRNALANIKTLSGLLPICASCKKVRDDGGYWNQIETYIREHADVDFSHGLCPDCFKALYAGMYEKTASSSNGPH